MTNLIRIGIDTSKSVFQVHGVDATEQPVLRTKLRRRQMVPFFAKVARTRIGIEACGPRIIGRVSSPIGPIGATLLAIKVTEPQAFRCGRNFAAWLGLTPKDHSTAGKTTPVALANKTARIAWKLMVSDQPYEPSRNAMTAQV